jgi:23S rRNA G2445 N2-methylase RlmL
MSKYDSLWKYLESNGNEQMRLSFEEIKNIIGFDIDHSFLTYKKEAKEYSYEVGKISLKEKHVTFIKVGDER